MRSQQPDSQNNLLLAVILSMAVLLGWQFFYAGPKMREEQARRQAETQQQAAKPSAEAPSAQGIPRPDAAEPGARAVPAAGAPQAPALTREAAIQGSPRLAVETPSLKGSIGLQGGRIDDLLLAKYHETVDPKSPNVVLFSPASSPNPYFAEYGWVAPAGAAVKLPSRDTLWQVEKGDKLTPSTPVTLAWDNGEGLIFHRTISVDDAYLFKIVDEVENRAGADITLFPYARVRREGTPEHQAFYILHEGLIAVAGAEGLQEITYSSALDNPAKTLDKVTGGWLGITDKYWATALIPNQGEPYQLSLSGRKRGQSAENDAYQADYLLPALNIPQGARKSVVGHLYAGAKEVKTVERYQTELGVTKFDLMIDWGWFYFITKPLFYLMELINSVLHNFGFTILALTLIVKAAFFPLANKSYESMAKMKKLQPEMERLRERYKDDKARQQQELMALYQKEKINPLAGCLPILIQIPVFFALYKVLFITIDMRHAPFVGWIQDLSAPDPTSLFNLFGLIPFAVPEFLHIGAWPLVMGLTMWLQMQLNPQQPDPVQQQIFNWMPVIFTWMLASFPAGLVIYWAWNNILSLGQQWYIMKRQGAEVPLIDNLRRTFAPLTGLLNSRSNAKK